MVKNKAERKITTSNQEGKRREIANSRHSVVGGACVTLHMNSPLKSEGKMKIRVFQSSVSVLPFSYLFISFYH